MKKNFTAEIKVGLFVTIGVGLLMVAILVLGGDNLFSRKNSYFTHFKAVDGLIPGAKVTIGGVPVGVVEGIEFDYAHHDIQVEYSVLRKSSEWIRKDSTVEIATQGVLGDKYISINPGAPDQPPLSSGSDIPNRPGKDLTQFLSKGDQLMISLNGITSSLDRILRNFETDNRSDAFFKGMASTAKSMSSATEKLNQELDQVQLKRTIKNLNQIFEKINNGTGTIGALVNDPSLYDQVKALLGGANRNRIIRNLVRQTIKKSEENPAPETSPSPGVKE